MVTQVLGLGTPEPETRSLPLQTGDWLVLCSDGLNDELTDGEIAQILRTASGVEDVAGALVAQALENGGRDNVSVVAVQYDGPSAAIVREQQSASESSAMSGIGDFLRSPLALGMGGAILVFIIFWIVTRGA
jgi:protein phosphatase